MNRDDFIRTALMGILSRKTPPQALKANQDGQRAEVATILRTIGRHAPQQGYDIWWDRFEDDLSRRMKTHGWPIASEVEASCRAAAGHDGGRAAMDESRAVQMLSDWHSKFGKQMPGMGRDDRTAELIRRGVLANEREARFCGYDLDTASRARALDQAPGRAELAHHERVLARLRGNAELTQ